MSDKVGSERIGNLNRRELFQRLGGLLLFSNGLFASRNNSQASIILTNKLEQFVREHQIAGAVGLVSRSGRVVYERAVGRQGLEGAKPMRPNTIFDIRSMTKAVTAVAVMCLVEDGKLRLEDPIANVLPEFAELQVAEASGRLRPPKRQVTLLDLLTHTSGMSENRPPQLENLTRVLDRSLKEVVKIIAQLPFAADPGAPWNYSSMGYAVLGRAIEARTGKPYQDFVAERVLRPLDMRDSFYFPPRDRWPRIAAMYIMEDGALHRDSIDIYRRGAKYSAPEFGLFSTARDMDHFFEMMLNGGSFSGNRVLSPKSVDLMVQPRTPTSMDGVSQGLAWFICTDPEKQSALRISKGSFGVAGASGTFGWADPDQKRVRLFLVQRFNSPDTERNAFMSLAAGIE